MGSSSIQTYQVNVTADAKADLEEFVYYLLFEKSNEQAAANLINDYLDTISELERVAGSLKLDEDTDLANWGYH